MSNAFAIATVSATLKRLLDASVNIDVPHTNVNTKRPSQMMGDQAPEVNIFLYQISYNTAFVNNDLPTRNFNHSLIKRPPACDKFALPFDM